MMKKQVNWLDWFLVVYLLFDCTVLICFGLGIIDIGFDNFYFLVYSIPPVVGILVLRHTWRKLQPWIQAQENKYQARIGQLRSEQKEALPLQYRPGPPDRENPLDDH